MSDKGWKQYERRVCRRYGVERKPVSGRQTNKHGADNEEHPVFVIQCKLDKSLAKHVVETVLGTARKAEEVNKVGIVHWKIPGMRDENSIIMLRQKDWLDLHGEP